MPSIVKTSIFSILASTVIAMPVTAFAGSFGYNSTIASTVKTSVKLDIRVSEDLAYRANNLPKSLKDRSNARGFNDGFGGNGYYGDKDIARLTENLSKRMAEKFEKRGIILNDNAPVTLIVTLEDVKPNRPTFEQLSRQSSLSFKSFSTGGAEIKSELVDASGASLGTANYKWFETDIRDAAYGGTWQDAHRAISRYSSKIAKTLATDANKS